MADELKLQLFTLTKNLNTLREREAKYGGNTPLDLLNLIDDHLTAVALFEQCLGGQLSREQLETEILPLNLAINRDIMGSARAMGLGSQMIIQQAQSALAEARQQDAYEKGVLAEAVARIASNLQSLVSPFAKQPQAGGDSSVTFALSSSLIQGGKLVGSPYKALIDYKIPDAPLFHGRRPAIRELFSCLQPGTMTILHAESGAGKSSLLQAGLASRLLARGHLPLYLRPWNQDPALAIKRAFIPNLTKTPGLAQAPLPDFLQQVNEILGQNTRLYLFLDQFEEFFNQLDPERQAHFVAELALCLDDPTQTTCWVLALRDEYFGRIATFSPRIRNPFERQYLLQPLTYEQAARVIAEPAARLKVQYEGNLVDQILQDLNPARGMLSPPEVQLVCSHLFEQLMERLAATPATPYLITRQMYEETGGAQGILRHHLANVLEKNLSLPDRRLARRILENLVTSDGRMAVRSLPELVAGVQTPGESQLEAETVGRVLQLLVDHRLVRSSDDKATDSEGAYELAHAYLLTEIEVDPEVQARKSAQELLDREVESYRQYGSLLDRQKLGIIESQRNFLTLNEAAHDLLRRSRADKNRQLYRRLGLALAIFAVLLFLAISTGQFDVRAGAAAVIIFLILLGLAAWAMAGRTEAKRAQKLALARGLSAEALNRLDTDAELSLLLALEAVKQTDLAQAENTLRQVMLQIRPWQALNTQSAGVTTTCWSPDGRRVALGLKNGAIQLWDSQTAALLTVLTGHTEAIRHLGYSPSGQMLASASALTTPLDFFSPDDGVYGSVRLWDATTNQLLGLLEGHSGGIFSLTWSPDGAQVATAAVDKTIKLWDASTRQERATLTGHTAKVRGVAWHPSQPRLASVSENGEIFIWDVTRCSVEKQLSSPPMVIFDVAWQPDGCRLATAAKDGGVRIWDSVTGQVTDVLTGHNSFVRSVSWRPDGRRLASSAAGNNKIIVWDVEAGQSILTLTGHTDWIRRVAWDATGTRLVSAADDGTARIWQIDRVAGLTMLEGHTDEPNHVAWSPDGKLLASAGKDSAVRLWQPETGRMLAVLSGHSREVWSVAWRPDGMQLVTTSIDKTARVWNLPHLQTEAIVTVSECAATLTNHNATVYDALWSHDGRLLATAGGDRTIQIWDAQTMTHRLTLTGHEGDVLEVDFSPDDQKLASAGADRKIILWDLTRGQKLTTLEGHTNFIWDVSFSPDGQWLVSASGDATVRLWRVATGEMVARFNHERSVASAAWNHAGTQVASASDDGQVYLWDVAGKKLAGTLTGHNGGVWCVNWSPDDTQIVTAAADKFIRIFYSDFKKVLGLAQGHKQRELTSAERDEFLGGPAPQKRWLNFSLD